MHDFEIMQHILQITQTNHAQQHYHINQKNDDDKEDDDETAYFSVR